MATISANPFTFVPSYGVSSNDPTRIQITGEPSSTSFTSSTSAAMNSLSDSSAPYTRWGNHHPTHEAQRNPTELEEYNHPPLKRSRMKWQSQHNSNEENEENNAYRPHSTPTHIRSTGCFAETCFRSRMMMSQIATKDREIQSLKQDLTNGENTRNTLVEENRLLKRAVTTQDSRLRKLQREYDDSREEVKSLQEMILNLQYHLNVAQATASNGNRHFDMFSRPGGGGPPGIY